MRNGKKCEMQNVKCEMRNTEREMRNAKCDMRNASVKITGATTKNHITHLSALGWRVMATIQSMLQNCTKIGCVLYLVRKHYVNHLINQYIHGS